MRLDAQHVRVVTSIGAGPIGAGWTAFFLARGYQVRAYLHSMDEEKAFRSILDTAWPCLVELGLPKASLDNLTVTDSLEEAVSGTEFVQESAPERLEIKQELYRLLGEITLPVL